ncbi:MAG TPA: NAD(P)-dependent oxidoreductase [Rhodocyclaceae bacterium]|nr:NAD(P)-dependent oxidoreductase [Rhodocyclaceae bacterium]
MTGPLLHHRAHPVARHSARHVVASQFGAEFDARLRTARPDIEVLSLPRTLEWPLPPEVNTLLAVPVSAALRNRDEPSGWPWGLRWVQLISIGIDNYPAWFLRRPHVTTAYGVSAQPISDYVLACIQHALRLRERTIQEAAQWRQIPAPTLAGSTLGLFGFGAIGQALARKALALGLRVRALRKSRTPLGIEGVEEAESLQDLLAHSDHLVLVAPGTPATRHAINAQTLAQAKPGLHLVNVSRGSLIDQEALRAALDDGRVAFASLDVTEPEPLPDGHWLFQHPKVQLTPHSCANSPQLKDALLAKVLRGLEAIDRGELPADLVDLERGY